MIKHYKELKNLIHNDYKITRNEIIELIKNNTINERMRKKADKLIKNEIDKIFDNTNRINIQIRKLIKDTIERIYNNEHNAMVFVADKNTYLSKMVINTVNKRVEQIVNGLINEKLIYKLLKEKLG